MMLKSPLKVLVLKAPDAPLGRKRTRWKVLRSLRKGPRRVTPV